MSLSENEPRDLIREIIDLAEKLLPPAAAQAIINRAVGLTDNMQMQQQLDEALGRTGEEAIAAREQVNFVHFALKSGMDPVRMIATLNADYYIRQAGFTLTQFQETLKEVMAELELNEDDLPVAVFITLKRLEETKKK